jgi:hypothetical protein
LAYAQNTDYNKKLTKTPIFKNRAIKIPPVKTIKMNKGFEKNAGQKVGIFLLDKPILGIL